MSLIALFEFARIEKWKLHLATTVLVVDRNSDFYQLEGRWKYVKLPRNLKFHNGHVLEF
jgi:hypothetical protein